MGVARNAGKCVVVPFWSGAIAFLPEWLAANGGVASAFKVSNSAKYLGLRFGTEVAEESWCIPVANYVK
eukprot:6155786-Alexandrium_andersonii.AAC.1